ncbi:MAG: hypothetical protein Q4D34_05500 [Eggerthellaceae bacterium]|nr:hypothetical protein [Eggerthellaceae bacterium]
MTKTIMSASSDTRQKSPYYGAMQKLIDSLFEEQNADALSAEEIAERILHPTKVRRLDVIIAAESLDLPDELLEIVNLLPPGLFSRQRLCDQLNSAICGHAWGQRYGTVE